MLPFASGTGSAVKGVVMDLVGGEEKADALSGIALVEKLGAFPLNIDNSTRFCCFILSTLSTSPIIKKSTKGALEIRVR